ncbi:MAG: alpha/beta hydrolase [Pseudomonadota bacterium]
MPFRARDNGEEMKGVELVPAAATASPTAEWIVMVHGMSQDSRVFDRQIQAFQSRYRILLVDLPGHGAATEMSGPFGHVEFADHVAKAMRAYEIPSAIIWGTHTGATIGLLLAVRSPRLVGSLVLEGPVVPGRNPPVVVELIEAARDRIRHQGREEALQSWWADSCWFDSMRQNPEAFRADAHRAIIEEFSCAPWLAGTAGATVGDIRPGLSRITQPVLIYNGAGDHPDFFAARDEITSRVHHAEVAVIDGAGGFPAWEMPDAVNARVHAFLDARSKG